MQHLKVTFRAMGGNGELTIAAPEPPEAKQAIEAAINEVQRIEAKYSRYQKDSWVSRANQAAGSGQWLAFDAETGALLDRADQLYQISGGRFDITSGILRKVWSFDQATPQLPSPQALNQVLPHIAWPRVEISQARLRLPAHTEIDFGGFGKEYAADQAAEVLKAHGIAHGLVNLAGDVRIIGPQPNGSSWGVGVQSPRKPGELLATIPLSAGGFATSGDYERFFDLDGRRYCHILNPLTGYPVTYWQSVSIAGPDALTAGSYATLAMLLEADGLDFLRASGLKFLAINQSHQIFTD